MATVWRNDKCFYEALKKTPLAQSKDKSVEEVAVWIDLNGGINTSSLIKIFKAIEKNYHVFKIDDLEDVYNTLLSRVMCNSQYGKIGQTVIPRWSILNIHFSDRALYWLFKTLNETNVLDAAALDSTFIKYVKDAKNKHNSRITNTDMFGHNITSNADADLYEIFAELEDIIKHKCTLQSKQYLQ